MASMAGPMPKDYDMTHYVPNCSCAMCVCVWIYFQSPNVCFTYHVAIANSHQHKMAVENSLQYMNLYVRTTFRIKIKQSNWNISVVFLPAADGDDSPALRQTHSFMASATGVHAFGHACCDQKMFLLNGIRVANNSWWCDSFEWIQWSFWCSAIVFAMTRTYRNDNYYNACTIVSEQNCPLSCRKVFHAGWNWSDKLCCSCEASRNRHSRALRPPPHSMQHDEHERTIIMKNDGAESSPLK